MLETNPIPAPSGFRPAGLVLSASFATPPAIRKKRYTGARLAGVIYERKVQEHLQSLYGDRYVPSPWLRFFPREEAARWRWCQPDAILIDLVAGRITIIEVKYQFTSDAWWQVKHLYYPVLRTMFSEKYWEFDFCQVVKWYDPATPFPEKVVLAQEVGMKHSSFKVHIWRP